MKEQYEFPPEFIWGASTAAHQIEGNNVASDWWAREHAERTDLSEPSGDAADSYHRYGEDIRMLADAGLGMYRFSIEWARIEPAEGCFSKAQLLHYRQMIDACHENGVEPMVTLNHMTLPLWLATKGGWLNADAVDYFARYVRYVMPILHDVTWVCTINEPNMVALTRGGTEGSDFVAASLPAPDPDISATLVKAHRKAREILSENPRIKSGWTIACQAFHAMPGCEREMEEYQYPREDYFTEAAAGDDFIGVQAYLRTFIGKDGPVPVPEDAERTLTGWEYFPPALGIAIRHTWNVAKRTPIIVTENGIATADDRPENRLHLRRHSRHARRDGRRYRREGIPPLVPARQLRVGLVRSDVRPGLLGQGHLRTPSEAILGLARINREKGGHGQIEAVSSPSIT